MFTSSVHLSIHSTIDQSIEHFNSCLSFFSLFYTCRWCWWVFDFVVGDEFNSACRWSIRLCNWSILNQQENNWYFDRSVQISFHTFLMQIQLVHKVNPSFDNYLEGDPIESVFQSDNSLLTHDQLASTRE